MVVGARALRAAGLIATVLAVALPATAAARDCKAGHFHEHQGELAPDQATAEVSAREAWRQYTASEYGDDWAYWAVADEKSVTCERASTGRWRCIARAVPCRE